MARIRLMFLILLLGITTIARAEEKVITAPEANFEAQGGLRMLIVVRSPVEWK